MMNETKEIYAYADWLPNGPILVGKLFATTNRGKELFSFEYDMNWLKNCHAVLDPDLALFAGRQYAPTDKNIFGIFSDSCPDRWGRLLMKRRENIRARKAQEKPRQLNESDFLLGVYDESRMGALRFATEESGSFLAADKDLATPPWTTLRKLEAATAGFEQDESGLEEKWLNQLLAPGSSLGGARPKATVQAPDGSLWIAKFPSKHDEWNSGAWEMVTHELAANCGLHVPEAKVETFSKAGSTFLVKRFDREGEKRIHFSSAMTLLGKTDGASERDGSSYLDMVSFIKANGAKAGDDLIELWKRIVFSMAVSNTDDHLRNHGFLLEEKGWCLSPLYDVNPNVYGNMLSLNVNQHDASIDFSLAIESAKYFGIKEAAAKDMAGEIENIVSSQWRKLASQYGLSRSAIEYMSPAFDMALKK